MLFAEIGTLSTLSFISNFFENLFEQLCWQSINLHYKILMKNIYSIYFYILTISFILKKCFPAKIVKIEQLPNLQSLGRWMVNQLEIFIQEFLTILEYGIDFTLDCIGRI